MILLISSILLVLSFPGFDIEFLAWIALVPLFYAIKSRTVLRAFIYSYVCGLLFFLGTIYWLIHVTLPGMIITVMYLALYFGLFGAAASFGLRKPNIWRLLFIPASWVFCEWLRSNVFGGFGWALLGHSQSYTLPVIQIADVTGAYGVSFVIVLVNAAVFFTIEDLRNRKYVFSYALAALLILYATLAYGVLRTKNVFPGEGLKVALIQGNISQDQKWDKVFRDKISDTYDRLTKLAASEGADLVIWPEASVPGFLESEPDLFERVRGLASAIKTPLLVGTPTQSHGNKAALYNSAVLLDDEARILDRYDKLHLVPFGEYLPAESIFGFAKNFAPRPIGDFSAGTKPTVFKFTIRRQLKDETKSWRMLKNVRFSCLICFEDLFPELARKFAREGAMFLVNITNDAWFGKSAAAYQHAQASVFRAVENRVNVVRAANTGLSCFIDQRGRITDAVNEGGKNLFVEGYKIREIFLTRTRTFYTKYGDVFAYLCMLYVMIYIAYQPNKLRSKK